MKRLKLKTFIFLILFLGMLLTSSAPVEAQVFSRTINQSLTWIYNVRDYFAVGDGVADDTTAIQNTINAANGGVVYFPSGTYKITADLTDDSGNDLILIGESPETVTINGQDTYSINLTNSTAFNTIKFKGIHFYQFHKVLEIHRTELITIKTLYVENCYLTDGVEYFLQVECATIERAWIVNNKFLDLNVTGVGNAFGIKIGDDDLALGSDDLIKHCYIAGNTFENIISTGTSTTAETRAILLYGREAIIDGNHFKECHNAGGGSADTVYTKCRWTKIVNNSFWNCGGGGGSDAAISVKGATVGGATQKGHGVIISNNTIVLDANATHADTWGIYCYANDVTITNNSIDFYLHAVQESGAAGYGGIRIQLADAHGSTIVANNRLRDPGNYGIYVDGPASGYAKSCVISGNIYENMYNGFQGRGIYLPDILKNIAITGNIYTTVNTTTAAANCFIYMSDEIYDEYSGAITIIGNICDVAAGQRAFIWIADRNIEQLIITGNSFDGTPTHGRILIDCDTYTIRYSYINGNVVNTKLDDGAQAFTANDATPSIATGFPLWKTANSAGTTITMFDGGFEGQEITVLIQDGNTTIDFTGTNLKGNSGVDWSPGSGDFMRCIFDGTNWYCEIHDTTA